MGICFGILSVIKIISKKMKKKIQRLKKRMKKKKQLIQMRMSKKNQNKLMTHAVVFFILSYNIFVLFKYIQKMIDIRTLFCVGLFLHISFFSIHLVFAYFFDSQSIFKK